MHLHLVKTFVCIVYAMSALWSNAQPSNFNTQRNWSISKKELAIGFGATQFNGDLGGVNKLSSIHGFSDLKFPSTAWNAQLGYRFRYHPYYATKSRIQVGELKGNDALKVDQYQFSRNLNFRSFYLELSQHFELILIAREQMSCPRFVIKKRWLKFYQFYVTAGVGLLYFNPQANYNGSWVNLHPLKTEGQGLPNGPKPYKRITATVPLGLGFRWNISRMWRMGVELEYTPTFSDYLDDVGGVYYDKNVLASQVSQASADLSNPAKQNLNWFQTGMSRGNSCRDGYFSCSFLLIRNITYFVPKKKKTTSTESKIL